MGKARRQQDQEQIGLLCWRCRTPALTHPNTWIRKAIRPRDLTGDQPANQNLTAKRDASTQIPSLARRPKILSLDELLFQIHPGQE